MPISTIGQNGLNAPLSLTLPVVATTMGVGGATPSGSGSGVTFPATQSASSDANTLDDYEEGSWTPTFGRNSTDPTVTYTNRLGTYTKIGNMVYVFWDMTASSISGGSGGASIKGLPFTVSTNMAGYSVINSRDATAIAAGAAGQQMKGYAERNSTYLAGELDNSGTSGFGVVTPPTYNGSGRWTGFCIYQTA